MLTLKGKHINRINAALTILMLPLAAALADGSTDVPQLTAITPADSSVLNGFSAGDVLTFTTDFDDACSEGGFSVEITDDETAAANSADSVVYSDFTTQRDERGWVLTFYNDVKFTGDHTYTVRLSGHKAKSEKSELVASVTATYTGWLAPELTVSPASKDVLHSLDTLTFTCEKGIAAGDTTEAITIYGSDKQTIVTTAQEPVMSGNCMTATLTEPVAAFGTYWLHIPAGKFLLAGDYPCEETWIEYELTKLFEDYNITVSPENNSTVSSIEEITITFNDWDNAVPSYSSVSSSPVLYDEDGNEVAGSKTSHVDKNVCTITLDKKVKTVGDYTLIIPAKCFTLGSAGNSLSEEMTLYYTVEKSASPTESIRTVPAENTAVASLSSIQLWLDDAERVFVVVDNSRQPTLKDASGNTVTTGNLREGDFWKELIVNLADEVKTDGTYTLYIEESSFKTDGELYESPCTFTFVIDSSLGVASIWNDADETVAVYNLQGIMIRQGKKSEIMQGLNGLYIVNGKKVITGTRR